MNKSYYITTPIYYVNDVPHIGHAYTSIAADVIARFIRLSGKNVMFLTGTDEHGQKVEKAAIEKGISPQDFTDQTSARFRELTTLLKISNDDFIRTTDERHKQTVAHLWTELKNKGDIYLGTYEGFYAVRDEAFYDILELTEEGKAPTGAEVEWIVSPSYFFALSKWQDRLLAFYENNPDFIRPASRRNEVINFVKNGLTDLSISRTSFTWGIQVPHDEKHVIYVWLDALTNYLSALDYPNGSKYQEFWPADVHIMGKDILRFHAIYWPAFLMSVGIEPPKTIIAHGWWTKDGQKMSKSVGNVIDPFSLIEEFGLDQVRYFLMREVIFGSDGNYSRANLINRINSELANKIGNLMQRTVSFVYVNNNGKVPTMSQESIDTLYQSQLIQIARDISLKNLILIEKFDISNILNNIITIAVEANIYIDKQAPWNLKQTDRGKMLDILYILLETLRYIAIMLQAFIPDGACAMLNQLGIDNNKRSFKHLNREYAIESESNLLAPKPIFPRIESSS
jgi:methionyl-tRNA synthetase